MQPSLTKTRITSIDFARGVIMLIMAIDHVRDYFHITAFTADPLNVDTTTPAVFFTRWITHLCAPAFLFLSGMSAWLSTAHSTQFQSRTTFLIKRGLFIALFDMIIMTLILSFNPNYNFIFLTTLWAIGCSMILLGLALKISPKIILPIGLLLFLGHDAMTTWLRSDNNNGNGLLRVLFTGIYFAPLDKEHVIGFFYSILPWTGVLFLGYSIGPWLQNNKKMLTLGLSLIAAFILLRIINIYGDTQWQQQTTMTKNVLAFLNTSKYPPSLQFLCMTLGPLCLFLAFTFKTSNAFERFAAVYGRVPFFFFVTHFLLAHILLVIAFYMSGYTNANIQDNNTLLWFRPQQFGYSLPIMYAIWLAVVLLLYYPCKWFYSYKQKKDHGWLKYI